MAAVIRRFLRADRAQDLVEWSLLIALVVLGSATLMWNSSAPTAGVWTATNSALQASRAATGSIPLANPTSGGAPTGGATTGGAVSGSSGSGSGSTGGGDDDD